MSANETQAAPSLYEPPPAESEELTGEQLDMVTVQGEILALQAAGEQRTGSSGPEDLTWLPTWYLRVHTECDAVEKRIKEQAKVLQAEVDARRKALAYRWGREFQARVDSDLANQRGKKKSVNYATGKAGYRIKKETLVIDDEAALISWAKLECVESLDYVLALKTPLVDHLHNTGELPPGCSLEPAENRFFPAMATDALPEAPATPQLPADPPPAEDETHALPPANSPEPNAVDPAGELEEARRAVKEWVDKVDFSEAKKIAVDVACKSVQEMLALESVQLLRTAAIRLEALPSREPGPKPVSAEAAARNAF